jgi:hypothetical protein
VHEWCAYSRSGQETTPVGVSVKLIAGAIRSGDSQPLCSLQQDHCWIISGQRYPQIHLIIAMPSPASRASIVRLLSATSNQGCRGCGRSHSALHQGHGHHQSSSPGQAMRGMATPTEGVHLGPPPGDTDYAFEVL